VVRPGVYAEIRKQVDDMLLMNLKKIQMQIQSGGKKGKKKGKKGKKKKKGKKGKKDKKKKPLPGEKIAELKKLDTELLAWSGCRNNAVKMLYPKGGYMGWHHNANAAGYNILLSWSEKGLGFFRYQDPITKEIVTMQDTPGWTCKVGYYGRFDEPNRTYWHCASAEHEERFTLGYIIPHEGMWNDMTEDIQSL
jgi:hypothetical protein